MTTNIRKRVKAILWRAEEIIVLYKGLHDEVSKTVTHLQALQLQIALLLAAEASDWAEARLCNVKQRVSTIR